MVLDGLKPESVFRNFEKLTQIPRGSGNEKAVSDFLVRFAKENHLEVIQEESLNVIIKKPATKGYETSKTVILQGHMDMVCVKKEDFVFDFETDPIPLRVEDDWIKTKGTTLGADNGIAVAMAMSILESNDLPHPPLTVLITVEEETGMNGVMNLKGNHVPGDILINLDSEEEGVFLTSCAGGVRTSVKLPVEYIDGDGTMDAYELTISGLMGGHSGIEIHKNRANANKLMGRLLDTLDESIGINLISLNGGEKMNAIAKLAKATILIQKAKVETIFNKVKEMNELFSNEFKVADPTIKLTVKQVNTPKMMFTHTTKRKVINLLRLLPFGVQTMSAHIKDLVESSVNLGVIETKEQHILFSSAIRSSVRSLKYEVINRIGHICELTGASMELLSDYPEWEYKQNSPIRELMLRVYQTMYHKEAEVKAIHAGLECGFLKQKLGDIDMISIGPNMVDVHTPEERLSISSTKRVYEFLCEVLKNIK